MKEVEEEEEEKEKMEKKKRIFDFYNHTVFTKTI